MLIVPFGQDKIPNKNTQRKLNLETQDTATCGMPKAVTSTNVGF